MSKEILVTTRALKYSTEAVYGTRNQDRASFKFELSFLGLIKFSREVVIRYFPGERKAVLVGPKKKRVEVNRSNMDLDTYCVVVANAAIDLSGVANTRITPAELDQFWVAVHRVTRIIMPKGVSDGTDSNA